MATKAERAPRLQRVLSDHPCAGNVEDTDRVKRTRPLRAPCGSRGGLFAMALAPFAAVRLSVQSTAASLHAAASLAVLWAVGVMMVLARRCGAPRYHALHCRRPTAVESPFHTAAMCSHRVRSWRRTAVRRGERDCACRPSWRFYRDVHNCSSALSGCYAP